MCTDKDNNLVCCPPNKIMPYPQTTFTSSTSKTSSKSVSRFFNHGSYFASEKEVSKEISSVFRSVSAPDDTTNDDDTSDLIDILSILITALLIPESMLSETPSADSVKYLSDMHSSPQIKEMAYSASSESVPITSAKPLSDSNSSQEALSSSVNPETESTKSTSENDVNTSSTPEPETSESESISESSEASTTPTTPKVSTASPSPPTTTPKPIDNDYASAFPEPPVCGVSQGTFSRVVGGTDANLGDFPWIGLIAYNVTGGFIFKCGASLITSQHALTAAHCIHNMEDQLFFVRLGELDILDHNKTRPIDFVVKTKIKHENYSTTHGTNDIGILVFYRKVIFTDLIRPICLPLSKELRTKNFVNYRPFVAGWGQIKYKGPRPTHLQVLQLPVVTTESCSKAYEPLKIFEIDERVICAGGQGGVDACHGDSGGPLMQPIWDPINYTTYFYQTGIVSFGMMCGTPGYPSVYTRVSAYIEWIQKHVLGIDST
ncbi:venom serine protease Bi-VSP-like [Epargyreus clarus]|uniref:venom serine protease Bi-VSP-like n=1 Tax=Epargyreus clarus TaxID=520877 RepID=UPI003C30E4E5